MNLASPVQALLWSLARRTWSALLLLIAAVFIFISLVMVFFEDPTPRQISTLIVYTVLGSLFFLLLVTTEATHKNGSKLSPTGFPYWQEFRLPVSTPILFFTPLLYICALFQVALLIPTWFLLLLFDGESTPLMPLSILVLQCTLLGFCMSWWIDNKLANGISWLVMLALIFYEWIFPNLLIETDAGVITFDSPTNFLLPVLITLAMLGLTYAGVCRQRIGASFLGFQQANYASKNNILLRNFFNLGWSKCPNDSPTRAFLWKEIQFRSPVAILTGGVGGGLIALILLKITFLRGNWDGPLENDDVLGFLGLVYSGFFLYVAASSFSLVYKNGVARINIYNLTVPLSTARVVTIKLLTAIIGLLCIGLVMLLTAWFLGPLFIDNFGQIRGSTLNLFAGSSELSFAGILLRVTLLFVQFATTIIFAIVLFTWVTLKPNRVLTTVLAVALYGTLLLGAVYYGTSLGERPFSIEAVLTQHLWIVVAAIPLLLIYLSRTLIKDRLLNGAHFIGIVASILAIETLNLLFWFRDGLYSSLLGAEIVLQVLYSLAGFLPLVAVFLAIWTMHKLRHT